jgi:mRNA-degrading endonuclease toxin of MazEF toxin-antitoxin module
VPSLIQGRIVFARKALVDPQGKNSKCDRPFVIISPTDQILPGQFVVGVAISSDQIGPPDNRVDLPFGDNAKTGLRIKCAAICDWLVALKQDELDFGTGFLSATYLEEIIKKIKLLNPTIH